MHLNHSKILILNLEIQDILQFINHDAVVTLQLKDSADLCA
jgi:hypothetical protein